MAMSDDTMRLVYEAAFTSFAHVRREASKGGGVCCDSHGNSESAGAGISQSVRLSAGVPHPLTWPPECSLVIFPRTTALMKQIRLPSAAAPKRPAKAHMK
jgi:hypothetical protein